VHVNMHSLVISITLIKCGLVFIVVASESRAIDYVSSESFRLLGADAEQGCVSGKQSNKEDMLSSQTEKLCSLSMKSDKPLDTSKHHIHLVMYLFG